jgi:hypothetical protein
MTKDNSMPVATDRQDDAGDDVRRNIGQSTPPRLASTRLYVLLARTAPVGVVFRRGPSKHVLALSWDIQRHEFRVGQWFKGRIYERRCDLSPSGEKLIYFAAKYRAPLFTWTAVSRPPFLTALAIWPKGDAWGGGGLFTNERTIALNHRKEQMGLAEGFKLPKSMHVEQCGTHPGSGEDDPIWSMRLLRDGWTMKQTPGGWENKKGSKIWHEFSLPWIWTKSRGTWTLEMLILGIFERDGPWYVIEHRVIGQSGRTSISLGHSDWADWSQSGELLFARDGRLYRMFVDDQRGLGKPEELLDLREMRFESIAAPREATRWSGRAPHGVPLLP